MEIKISIFFLPLEVPTYRRYFLYLEFILKMKISIDIGSHSVKTARLTPEGIATVIPDAQTRLVFTPTAFRNTGGGFLIGADATILVGESIDLLQQLSADKPTLVDSQQKPWYAASLLALFIKKIRLDTDTLHIDGAVGCIPNGLPDTEQQTINSAIQLADIPFLGNVTSAVAAALYHSPVGPKPILVIDWGHSGLRMALVGRMQKEYQVLTHITKTGIGGKHWDELVAESLFQTFKARFAHLASPYISQIIAAHASLIKEALSEHLFAKQVITVESELIGLMLSRQSFEQIISRDFEQFDPLLTHFLKQATVPIEEIEEVILTGGCTLVPMVKQVIKKRLSSVKKWYEKDPLLANALGSVRYATQTESHKKVPTPKNTHPTLGVLNINPTTKNTEVDTIFVQTSVLPARTRRTYYTANSEQREINLIIVRYDQDSTDYEVLEKVVVGPLLGSEAYQAIEVTFLYDEDGTLRLSSYDPETGTEYQNILQISSSEGFQFYPQRQLVRSTAVNGVA